MQANPNPLIFNSNGVQQDSKQVSDYLLCRDCEQRLNQNGEDWFLKFCWRKDQFALATTLETARHHKILHSQVKVYHAAEIPQVNMTALTYFAASMYWRASVHQWQIAGAKSQPIQLGPYQELLRKFLMRKAQFPSNCILLVFVPENKTAVTGVSLTPYGGRIDSHHAYNLVVLGVGFRLLVGKQISSKLRSMCFVTGVGNPILRTDNLEGAIKTWIAGFRSDVRDLMAQEADRAIDQP
ncbi:MAG: hypothetical protein ACRD50_13660 [Candidatus Acidiferrales bacterium]